MKNLKMRSLSLSFLALFFFAGSGVAQTLKDSASIMQVRREPRHHDVVDNQWVRILDVRLPPGDTTFFINIRRHRCFSCWGIRRRAARH
ncbi:hypothetical protein ACQ86N_12155 [Puia sp. P3]|uniref:hypothetical protein n=1 Tax=Puia sp. P3 TaxID=3423952 RepID=UPI003D67D87B